MRKQPRTVLSHWQTAYEGFSTSVQDFYSQVEAAVKDREVPEVTFSRVVYKEGGVASAGREYLRVSRGAMVFDVCAAPYGTGFFFSSWAALDFPGYLPYLYLAVIIGLGFFSLAFGLSAFVSYLSFIPLYVMGAIYLFILGFMGTGVHKKVFGVEEAAEAMPFLGKIYSALFNPGTYFSVDTESMFQSAIHGAVLEAVKTVTEESGRRVVAVPERRVA
ncbi:MAG TPA: hypothetical protein VLB76_26685 [Thermoanaerobaculia bacterium]|nr:hypothetical protein [Thermoanaerobaculia bacterium]